jgi:sensor histidine kinase regulating citrate/malate metabolism
MNWQLLFKNVCNKMISGRRMLMKKTYVKTSTRIYLYNILLVFVTILITGTISLYVALHIRQTDMDTSIRNMASMVANLEEVQELLTSGQSNPSLMQELDALVDAFEQVDILVICDTESIRHYHTEKSRIGQAFQGDDQDEILEGADPYISEAEGTLGMQRRAFHAVYNEDGEIIGFVVASVLISSLVKIRHQISLIFLIIFLCMLLTGSAFAWLTSRRIRKVLHGHQPEEFSRLYKEQTEVTDALEEGICAIDTSGKIILMNQAARTLFEIPPDYPMEGMNLQDVYPETRLKKILETGKAEYNTNEIIRKQTILASNIPVYTRNELVGAVSLFRNKTEVTRLAEELTGARYMVDTLRAFNHEFMNKLHIILGLLEMNEVDQAKEYILKTSLVSGEEVSNISRQIPISNLAALLIGKLIRASELGIRFSLKADSYFCSKEKELPVDCYITLVGNLVENAMDELNHSDYPTKEIELGIYSGEGHTMITCDDTGGGIDEDILIHIYDRHTTTKGEGHGSGFALIKEIIDCYEGTIHIDTEKDMGTSIEIVLPI